MNFIASLVNRHRIECFVLDGDGRVHRSFTRTQWQVAEVLTAAKELLHRPALKATSLAPPALASSSGHRDSPRRSWARSAIPLLPSVLVAFFPRCPMCWAAYMSLLGIAGIGRIPYAPWLLYVFMILMAVNLVSLWMRAGHRRSRMGFWLSLMGSATILLGGWWLALPAAAGTGLLLHIAGSLLGVRGAVSTLVPNA